MNRPTYALSSSTEKAAFFSSTLSSQMGKRERLYGESGGLGGGVQGAKMVPGDDGEDGRGKVRRGGRKKMEGGCVRGRRSYRGEEERSVSGEALVWGMEQCEGRRPGESGEENQIRPELDGMRRREERGERRWSNRKLPSLFCGVPILFGLSSCGDKTLDMCAVRGKGKKRVLSSYVQRRGEREHPYFLFLPAGGGRPLSLLLTLLAC